MTQVYPGVECLPVALEDLELPQDYPSPVGAPRSRLKAHRLKIMQQNKHWASSDNGKTFHPRPEETIHKTLPPGLYNIYNTPNGIVFGKSEDYNTDELMRFNDALLATVVSEIKTFWTKKELFEKNDIPFKRGMLLFGPPGSGKSATIKLIINDVIEMGGIAVVFDNAAVFHIGMETLRSMQPETPVVVIMEDIDTIAQYDETGLTNLLDGLNYIDNIVFLATTNNINHISDRVKNRPSRFDKRIFIGPPKTEIRKIYINHLVSKSDFKIDIDKWAKDTDGMTFAHIKELYVSVCFFDSSYDVTLERLKTMVPKESYDIRDEPLGEMFLIPMMRTNTPPTDIVQDGGWIKTANNKKN